MIDITLAKNPTNLQPLEYHPVKLDGKWTARMRCGNVHQDDIGLLSLHTIATDGTVTPSVECAYDECDFHPNHVRLVGWTEAIKRAQD